jgi:hypothetical protein
MKAKTMRHILLWAVVICIYLYSKKYNPTELVYQKADVRLFQFAVGYFLFLTVLDTGKYQTSQFIGNNIHGSVAYYPEPVGLWTVFSLGDIEAFELKIKGRDLTIICPSDAWKTLGNNIYCPVKFRKVDYKEVPHECYNLMDKERMNTENIYIGYATEEQETNDPDLVLGEKVKQQLERKVNLYEDMLKGKWNIDESALDHLSRLQNSMRGKESVLQKLLPKKNDDHDEK